MIRRLLIISALVGVLALSPVTAGAEDATIEQVADLAARAAADAGARTALLDITSIDGEPVDMARVLDGTPATVERRLRALASLESGDDSTSPDEVQRLAEEILGGDEYAAVGAATTPSLFDRIANWLGELIPTGVAEALFSGTLWSIIGVIVVAFAGFSALRARSGAPRLRMARATGAGDPAGADADELEAQADSAQARGEFAASVRLRFRAGASRLAALGLITKEATATTGQVRRAVATPTMDRIAADFDRIVYGVKPAASEDATRAAEGWAAVRAGMEHRNG